MQLLEQVLKTPAAIVDGQVVDLAAQPRLVATANANT